MDEIKSSIDKIEPMLDITKGGNLFSDSEKKAFKNALSALRTIEWCTKWYPSVIVQFNEYQKET